MIRGNLRDLNALAWIVMPQAYGADILLKLQANRRCWHTGGTHVTLLEG